MRIFGLLWVLFWSQYYWDSWDCWADQIVMHNGDTLGGLFKGIVDEQVLWQSTLLGELRIAKAKVKNIHSEQTFKLRGQATPCAWQSLANQVATFVCHKGEVFTFSLLSLQQVVPFTGHRAANHSYSGNLRVSGLKKQGNTESQYWQVNSGVVLRHGDWRHSIALSTSGQSILLRDGQLVTEDRDRRDRAEYALDWFFLPQYYWSNVLSAESDTNRNIQEEYKWSSGLGVQFWERTQSALSVVLGLEHNRTYLKDNPPDYEPESYTSIRLGTDYRYKFNKGVGFYHNNIYSSSLDSPVEQGGAKRWEFSSRTGFDCPIGFGVSADIHLEWNYKNHAKDQNPDAFLTDTVYRVGLNYAW